MNPIALFQCVGPNCWLVKIVRYFYTPTHAGNSQQHVSVPVIEYRWVELQVIVADFQLIFARREA